MKLTSGVASVVGISHSLSLIPIRTTKMGKEASASNVSGLKLMNGTLKTRNGVKPEMPSTTESITLRATVRSTTKDGIREIKSG